MKTQYTKFEGEFIFNGREFLGIGRGHNKTEAYAIAYNDAWKQAELWFDNAELIYGGWREHETFKPFFDNDDFEPVYG